MPVKFIHLNLHTEYSLVDSIIRIPELITVAKKQSVPAIAITDFNNLFATVKFYRQAQAAGIKPIIGCECTILNSANPGQPYHVIFLCCDRVGYHSLTKLISQAYLEGQNESRPCLRYAWLTPQSTAGLIALSGARQGDVGQAIMCHNAEAVASHSDFWQGLLGDRYYLEIQRLGVADEEYFIAETLQLAATKQIPVVATNAIRFMTAEEFEPHEARVCIHEGVVLEDPKRSRNYTEQQYFRSEAEMVQLFSDIPSSLENTVEIAKRCNLEMSFDQIHLPNFPVPDGFTIEAYLCSEANLGLKRRLGFSSDSTLSQDQEHQLAIYHNRLEIELSVICEMGFSGYFLIVADFIRWAKQQAIAVGPGRGSGAGSLVAYVLDITDLDPLKHELLFERFLNPERVSMPDFDIDFCMDKRDLVIDYVAQKYGRQSVSQIITYGTMAARAVVRDVGRVLAYPFGFVDKVAKLIPFELGITLDKALEQEQLLRERYQAEEEVQILIDLAKKLEGVVRNAGKHAGGVVISPSLLTDFVPLFCEAGGTNLVTQFDKDDIEAVGLVKFDFLGLRTLTIIDWAVQRINHRRQQANQEPIAITHIPLNDTNTYRLLKKCQTTAVFQLESRGMKDLIKRLQPDCFEEIIALVALFRPGPLQSGMVDDFVDRKHGRAAVAYLHPKLKSILSPTYGVILYQEQVMQIAQVLAGYTLGGADILRRAMGKKKPEEMAKQREIFITGATQHGVAVEIATTIFDLMEKFAGYGFNKSHSAAYALIAYQTAWLKTHYPAEFMAAVLSSDMDNTDKVMMFIEECQLMKIEVLPPDINSSIKEFHVVGESQLLFGLGAIKGVGESAIENILTERSRRGAFRDLFDFCARVDLRKVNRRVMVALIQSGTMDALGAHRASLLASLDIAVKISEQNSHNQQCGIEDLFSETFSQITIREQFVECEPWTKQECLAAERLALGFYMSGHPLQQYSAELSQLAPVKIADLNQSANQSIIVAGMITQIRTMLTKRNDLMAFITISDQTAKIELAIFPELFQSLRETIEKDAIVIVEADKQLDEYSGNIRLSAKQIYTVEQARLHFAKYLRIELSASPLDQARLDAIQQQLSLYTPGLLPVRIAYRGSTVTAEFALGKEYRVIPRDSLVDELKTLCGEEKVRLVYQVAE